jgi:hypothetical protein
MAATAFENQNAALVRSRVDWGAIWAGVFAFIAIWSVFGTLGAAIFASAANPGAARPITGMGWGMSIWAIVLTIIAMYVGGRVTGSLTTIANRREGVVHGLAMFGLSVAAVLVIVVLAGNGISSTSTEAAVHSPYLLDVTSGLGWAGFLSLFFGWLAAMGGASSGAQQKTFADTNVHPIRNVNAA